ncbi:TPA: hypothetical protein TZ820_002118 [Streptococcus suis]|nr:hypothetical protein [Streptococcus suis]HEL2593010.1 hypothetical protein [Streptococcus suis]
MENKCKKIQIGKFISLLIDFLVMLLWLASFRFDTVTLMPMMLLLTILHALFIIGVYHSIKRNSLIYDMPVQQKYIILVTLVVTSLLCLVSALTGGSASTLFTMLINGVLVLSYPDLRFVK